MEMKYQPDSTAVGSGGVMTFLFYAVDTGETKIALVYHRPFKKDRPLLKTFDVTITVFEKWIRGFAGWPG
jgi:predicted secreted protein